jgi:glycosyltransferase involved in cell wall biosynthesis
MTSGKLRAMQNRLRISLVIPVYNEESYLADCLRSALAQHEPFHEIIVVDNNSTDLTARIARQFPEVTLISERKQGVVHARNRGFNTTSSDIIARIDADTRLPSDWTETVQTIFADKKADAVSGKMEFYDMAAPQLLNTVDLFFRRYFAKVLGRQVALQASNMAIRREAWLATRQHTCSQADLHEDFDLAIHAYRNGHSVTFDERLVAQVGYRQAESSFLTFCQYVWLSPRTYRVHKARGHWWMYPAVAVAILAFGLLKVLHRAADADGKFSLQQLLYATNKPRVNPATFVD